MKTPVNKKLDGSIGDLAPSALNQIRIFYLGGDVFCSE
jgi:hypothetical protein